MPELAVIPTAVITVGFVAFISYIASNLESLPVDFAGAGVSLVLLFVELASHGVSSAGDITGSVIWFVVLAFSIMVFFVGFTLATYRGSKLKKNASRQKSILTDTGWSVQFFANISYFFSLTISTWFILSAISLASNAKSVLQIDIHSRGALGQAFMAAASGLPTGWVPVFAFLTFVIAVTIFTKNLRSAHDH